MHLQFCLHCYFTICWIVPEACACCLQPCSILLHDDTVYCENIQANINFIFPFYRGLQLVGEVRSRPIPIYLKGFPSLLRWLRQSSTTLLLHWFTRMCWYVFPPIVASIACKRGASDVWHLIKAHNAYLIEPWLICNGWQCVQSRLRIHSNPLVANHSLLALANKKTAKGPINAYLLYYFTDFFDNERRLIEDKTMLITII